MAWVQQKGQKPKKIEKGALYVHKTTELFLHIQHNNRLNGLLLMIIIMIKKSCRIDHD